MSITHCKIKSIFPYLFSPKHNGLASLLVTKEGVLLDHSYSSPSFEPPLYSGTIVTATVLALFSPFRPSAELPAHTNEELRAAPRRLVAKRTILRFERNAQYGKAKSTADDKPTHRSSASGGHCTRLSQLLKPMVQNESAFLGQRQFKRSIRRLGIAVTGTGCDLLHPHLTVTRGGMLQAMSGPKLRSKTAHLGLWFRSAITTRVLWVKTSSLSQDLKLDGSHRRS